MRHCAHRAPLRPRLQSAAHKGVEIVAPMLVDLCVEIDADDRKARGYTIAPADATAGCLRGRSLPRLFAPARQSVKRLTKLLPDRLATEIGVISLRRSIYIGVDGIEIHWC